MTDTDYSDKLRDLDLEEVSIGVTWISASCPFHEDVNPSFGINRQSGGWNCYSCGAKGPWGYLLELLGIGEHVTVSDFQSKVAHFVNPDDVEEEPEHIVPLPPRLGLLTRYSPGFPYLIKRGVPEDDIDWFACLYSPEMHYRVILPSWDLTGRVEYWAARDYGGRARLRYLTPKGGRPKGCCMNLERIRANFDELIIAEGPLSAMVSGRNATCTYSQQFSYDQVQRINSLSFRRICVAYDGEPRARNLAIALCRQLYNADIHLCLLPDGKDPGDLGRDYMNRAVREAAPFSEMRAALERLTPHDRERSETDD